MLEKMEGVIKHSKSKDWQHQANKTQGEDKQNIAKKNKSKTQYNTQKLKR